MTTTITFCNTCADGNGLAAALRGAAPATCQISTTDCMSGCARASTVAFRAPGKTAYLFGDLTLSDLPDLITFAALYTASPDGVFTDARPLGALRHKALARIPAQAGNLVAE